MGLFRRNKSPELASAKVVNADIKTSAEIQRDRLKNYFSRYKDKKSAQEQMRIEQMIRKLERGCFGEDYTLNMLKRAPMNMLIVRDLNFRYNDETAVQIDFLVITDKLIFAVETKNWGGNFRIDSQGEFIALINGSPVHRESPISQSNAHTGYLRQLYHTIMPKDRMDRFDNMVVWANQDSVLERTEAPADIARKIVYPNGIVQRITEYQAASKLKPLKQAEMQHIADSFLAYCIQHPSPPKCPLCGRGFLQKKNGINGRPDFLGCSRYNKNDNSNSCSYMESIA